MQTSRPSRPRDLGCANQSILDSRLQLYPRFADAIPCGCSPQTYNDRRHNCGRSNRLASAPWLLVAGNEPGAERARSDGRRHHVRRRASRRRHRNPRHLRPLSPRRGLPRDRGDRDRWRRRRQRHRSSKPAASLALIRKEEERRALAVVGVDSPSFLALPDFYFTLSAEETERKWGSLSFATSCAT